MNAFSSITMIGIMGILVFSTLLGSLCLLQQRRRQESVLSSLLTGAGLVMIIISSYFLVAGLLGSLFNGFTSGMIWAANLYGYVTIAAMFLFTILSLTHIVMSAFGIMPQSTSPAGASFSMSRFLSLKKFSPDLQRNGTADTHRPAVQDPQRVVL